MFPKIMVIGSDNTSDRFGSALAREILRKCPEASLIGIGGPLIESAGVRLLYDVSDMVSLGVFQSIKGSQVIRRVVKRVAEAMDQEKPDLALQIGLPFSGFRLLEIARTKDIPVFYYYTPFSRGLSGVKTSQFSDAVHKVLAISRTEASLCEEIGVDTEFVGHPLIDLADLALTAAEARKKLGIDPHQTAVVAVLPGSREAEVKNVLPTVLKALNRVAESKPDLAVVVTSAPTLSSDFMERILKKCRCGRAAIESDIYAALRSANLAITSIGTSSLEAALLGVPSLAVYQVPGATHFMDKLLNRKPHMAMANHILGEAVIPEYIQSDFGVARVAEGIEHLLDDVEARKEIQRGLSRLESELGKPGSVERAAAAVLEAVPKAAGC